jgi:chaperone modulatory protein CbpM
MKLELTETLWLDERQTVSLAELAELSGLSETEVRELTEYQALVPCDPDADESMFTADCVVTARIASRLRADFELEASNLALVVTLLERIRHLESQVRSLDAQRPRRVK